jgi:putative transcriptional regulator
MKRSRTLHSVHEAARGLHAAGAIDTLTMRRFDAMCLPPVPALAPRDVRRIRAKLKVSQAVFAALLNVGPATVASWEREGSGKTPSGPSAKLLDLVDRKGLDALL